MDLDYLLGYLLGLSTFLLSGESVIRAVRQLANEELPNALLDTGSLLEAYKRSNMSAADVESELAKDGIASDKAEIMILLTETLLGAGDNVVALYRGSISADTFNTQMRKLGFSASTIKTMTSNFETRMAAGDLIEAEHRGLVLPPEVGTAEQELYGTGLTAGRLALYRQLALRIPQVADLLNFSAWNVEDPAFVEKFGLNKNMPADFLANATKLGIPNDFAQKLWASHWQPIPIFILKELYQTGQVSQDQLLALFNVYQIPPGFQPAIMAAFSKQLSDAQIIEGLQNGSITEPQLDGYLNNLGYAPAALPIIHKQFMDKSQLPSSEEKAAAAAQRAQFKGLSVATVMSSYEEGLITGDQVTTYLTDLGIEPDIITFNIQHSDYKITKSQLNDQITAIGDQFMLQQISQADAIGQLAALGVSATKQTNLIYKWSKIKPATAKEPTKADFDLFLKQGLIDLPTYFTRMQKAGYSYQDVLLFVAAADKKSLADTELAVAQAQVVQPIP